MVHEICKEMLVIHALSALDVSDQRELQEHLETCAACRMELEDWQATAATLAYVAPPVEPSAHVREQILERVRGDDHSAQSAGASNVLNFSRAAGPARSSWPALAAIAAAILFIAMATSLIVLWRQNRTAQSELARLAQEYRLQE